MVQEFDMFDPKYLIIVCVNCGCDDKVNSKWGPLRS